MHTAAKKLQSQRGASIIFALLVFMLCAFAGVAALVTAAANAGRYARLERDQQQYLSAASAATLLRDELHEQEIQIRLTMRHTYTWWYVKKPDEGAAIPYTLYSLNQYTFVDPPANEDGHRDTSASVTFHRSPLEACKVEKTGSVSALMETLLPDSYFSASFLQSDVPSYFFKCSDTMTFQDETGKHTYTDTASNAGTGPMDSPTDTEVRRLVITGQDSTKAPAGSDAAAWDGWKTVLGTVRADVSDIGDYGLRIDVSEEPADADADTDTMLYTTAFELPAQVTRVIATSVTVEDDFAKDPSALVPSTLKEGSTAFDTDVLRTAASYGRRITENTVTVTVSWKDNNPVVTRIY